MPGLPAADGHLSTRAPGFPVPRPRRARGILGTQDHGREEHPHMSIDVPQERPRPALGSLSGRASLRSRVAEALREALVVGELEPGSIYSAPALAQRLGVSATPVREAMMELAQEGLVEPVRPPAHPADLRRHRRDRGLRGRPEDPLWGRHR